MKRVIIIYQQAPAKLLHVYQYEIANPLMENGNVQASKRFQDKYLNITHNDDTNQLLKVQEQ